MQAMRKIREGIVASHRYDDFTLNVYIFVIRTTILLKEMESYHPALLYLLHQLYPIVPLSESLLHEFVIYHILDLACRQGDLAAAFEVRHAYSLNDRRIEQILKSLVHSDWPRYWRLKESMDKHQRCLMDEADDRIRNHIFMVLGKGYLRAPKEYVENATNTAWDYLAEKDKRNWALEGQTIVIRSTRSKRH